MLCIPDQYRDRWVQSQTKVQVITWKGACEVHERFTGEELTKMREDDPGLKIIAHPECPPDVMAAVADLERRGVEFLATEQVHLEFRDDGIRRLAEIAFAVNERQENSGARRLHTVMERLLDDGSFHAARRTGDTVAIDAVFVDAVRRNDFSNVRSDYADALRSLRATLAATEAAMTGRIINLPAE